MNAGVILAELRGYFPTVSIREMAEKIGRSESALLRWQRTGKARYRDMEALIAAFPIPPPNQEQAYSVENVPITALTELFSLIDKVKMISDNLKTQLAFS